MLDPDGFLAEGPGWNIFLVRDGVLYTPEPRNILLGVSRMVAMNLARELGIEVVETNLGRYEALVADELFCTSTPYGIAYFNKVEGQTVGDGTPGPVFSRIQDAWQQRTGVNFLDQAESYASRLSAWQQQQLG